MKMLFDDAPVIVAAGMDFEARIAKKGPGVRPVYGQNRTAYVRDLEAAVKAGARGVISFGVAGGLCPSLKPGDVVVASAVVTASNRFDTHGRWSRSLRHALPSACGGSIFAADDAVMTVLEKEALFAGTGAIAVDVESGVAAEAAERHGLPFAVLRVVLDPAGRSLPLSATVGVRDDGTTDPGAVIRSLLRRPGEIGELVRLAGDARLAKRSLLGCRKALGPFFSLLDPLDLPLNVE
jgi:hopanoid-associated phosphorylase